MNQVEMGKGCRNHRFLSSRRAPTRAAAGRRSTTQPVGRSAGHARSGVSRKLTGAALIALSVMTDGALADQQVVAVNVQRPPVIDGRADDAVWTRARAVTTIDAVAEIPLTLKAVYTEDAIFFLVQYPDATENREHKTMLWDEAAKMYRMGPAREDTFVFKWHLGAGPVDLRLSGDTPHLADIWYWKAYRTDHAGYADDKMHVFSITRMPRSQKILSATGHSFYLFRPGDAGEAAYRAVVHEKYEGDQVLRYAFAQPSGSRADIRAKGEWKEGSWTIEFARPLDTGQSDDVQFRIDRSYLFGVSRYEIAGRRRDPTIEQPDFGRGDVGERLTLIFR